ncbi:MAG TPA: signal recognition particle-docking protein FtsY [Parvularculaceae bacterium]|nr:signal recognition particle-docking protein FtsY [Amphiplicatus sp.]MCB9956655.1 signal recognition particle-docking protein FtsY [Caulobacterales bacterium]HPE31186.1 signal recognition particle-docking protein FtsY [Parvularculaceae bacterium]HRX39958.1 signal recognition particle-docking protein FtsY [Parvularculaceae bacterium]
MAKNFLSGLFGGKSSKAAEPKPEGDIPAEETAPPIEAVEVASEDETSLPISAPDADEPTTPTVESAPEKKKGFFSRLREGLSRSSNRLAEGVASIFTKKKLDEETIEELEELLISADLGVSAAARVAAALSKDRFDKEISPAEVRTALAGEVAAILTPFEKQLVIDPAHSPFVILMTGVNGAGKTTTIGKLAAKFAREGHKVMLAAGDTFRAAAIEQLTVWGERTGAPVVAKSVGADAAGLAYEAFQRAREEGADVLLIDTAGRLQNRRELMDELAKIVRVLKKLDETAPHATLLVLDATVGQNALSQAQVFTEIAGVDGLVMTKLDGTARGGVLVAVSEKTKLPIHYIGVGESVDDLQPFDATRFARALAGLDDEGKND